MGIRFWPLLMGLFCTQTVHYVLACVLACKYCKFHVLYCISVTVHSCHFPVCVCVQECGLKLTDVSPRGAHAMFETLRAVLHSGKISSRIQYMIEVLFAIRKDKFKVQHLLVLCTCKLQKHCLHELQVLIPCRIQPRGCINTYKTQDCVQYHVDIHAKKLQLNIFQQP